jgi:hypothetical protein
MQKMTYSAFAVPNSVIILLLQIAGGERAFLFLD